MFAIIAIALNCCLRLVTSTDIDFAEFAATCPHLYPSVFLNCIPSGNLTAENYLKVENVTRLESCLRVCCESLRCNVVLFGGRVCYHVECPTSELCLPRELPQQFGHKYDDLRMILVRPVSSTTAWQDVLVSAAPLPDELNFGANCMDTDSNCDLENCVRLANGKRLCKCKFGYFMDELKRCVPTDAQKQLESFKSETQAVAIRAATPDQADGTTASSLNATDIDLNNTSELLTETRITTETATIISTKPFKQLSYYENIFENPPIITLPIDYIVLDIEQVFRIANPQAQLKEWSWSKTNDSRAAGSIQKYTLAPSTTTNQPTLLLANSLVEGIYRLHLNGSIADDNRILSVSRVLTLIVERDPFEQSLVEIRTQTKISHFSEHQFRVVRRQLARLIRDSKLANTVSRNDDESDSRSTANLKLEFYDLEKDSQTDFVIIRFFVEAVDLSGGHKKSRSLSEKRISTAEESVDDNDTNNFWTHYGELRQRRRPRQQQQQQRRRHQQQQQQQQQQQRLLKPSKIVEFLNRKWAENRNFIGANGAGGSDIDRLKIIEIRERKCSNRCSGRGRCDPVTRQCHCQRFWFANPVRVYCGDGQSNCEWNWPVLATLLILVWLIVYILRKFVQFICNLCCRRRRHRRRPGRLGQRKRQPYLGSGCQKHALLSPACKCDYDPVNDAEEDDDDGEGGGSGGGRSAGVN